MLSRLFGFKLVSAKEYAADQSRLANQAAEIISLKEDARAFVDRIKAADKRADSFRFPAIDVSVKDPSPVDKTQRVLYVAQVAGLHTDILKPKLLQMIASLHQMLSEANNDREYDQALKGAVYFAWEMIRWGDLMVSEQVAIQRGEHPELSTDKIKE